MEDGIFPGYMSIVSDGPSEIEEERRLCYVGITRAMTDLSITCARQRMIRGETQYNMVSRFLNEIPGELMDQKPAAVRKREWEEYPQDTRSMKRFREKPFGGYGGSTYTADSLESGVGATRPANDPRLRPKAIVTPRRTEKENRPFFTKTEGGLSSLSKGAPAGGRPEYEVGDRVKHIKYREGTVLKIEEGARDFQVTVEFDGAGTKVMYAAFAKLQKL